MKALNTYIIEKFQVSIDNVKSRVYKYHPKDKDELIKCINEKIDKEGLGTKNKPLDLNDIDTSKITNMSSLFSEYGKLKKLAKRGQFDVSDWDVSNVEDMNCMFYFSSFDGDISDWDVSKVENMNSMFFHSNFTGKNGDIFAWNVSNVKKMHNMFSWSPLEKNEPKWYNDWYKKIFN